MNLVTLSLVIATLFLAGSSWARPRGSGVDGVDVRGYTRKDGTTVQGYTRSRPNAYKWDNDSYKPSEPAYNPSYTNPSSHHGSQWLQPNANRFSDNNPNNDYPQNSYLSQPSVPSRTQRRQNQNDSTTPDYSAIIRAQRERQLQEQIRRQREEDETAQLLQRLNRANATQSDESESANLYSMPAYQPPAYREPSYRAQRDQESDSIQTRYNPFSNTTESVPSSYQLRYNPMQDSWNYAAPNAQLQYNPMSDSWSYGDGN